MRTANHMEVENTAALHNTLASAIASVRPRVVIETGTFLGNGSTRAVLNAFTEYEPEAFHTIEVSRQAWQLASRNLADVPFLTCHWGLSLSRPAAVSATLDHNAVHARAMAAGDIAIDHSLDPVEKYLAEIRGGILGPQNDQEAPDGILSALIREYRHEHPLFALDSAGSLGFAEFLEVCRLMGESPFLLFLDDVNHVKHDRSRRHIQSAPGWKLWGEDLTNGWMVAEKL